MSDKLDKMRQMAQRLKDRVHIPAINSNGRVKIDEILTKYVPAQKVNEIAEKFKQETIGKRVTELVSRYEKFTGVEEIMALQNTVVDAQEQFMSAQERRRDLGKQVANIESRLKELHAEMQNIMKGDEKYLQLCTEEHKLIIQERALRQTFSEAEREERELFATMSAAVKLGHERERAHAERNKYWYIVASIFGTVLGIGGSTINNHLKMAEFRDMMEQQMARSASVLYAVAGGGGGGSTNEHITHAMKTEFAYQEQLAQSIKSMQENINNLVSKQSSLIDHLNHQEHVMETQLRDLKRLVITASQASAKSDVELAKAMTIVHHEMDENEKDNISRIQSLNDNLITDKIKMAALQPNQILTGIGIVVCAAIIFGNILGRVS